MSKKTCPFSVVLYLLTVIICTQLLVHTIVGKKKHTHRMWEVQVTNIRQ